MHSVHQMASILGMSSAHPPGSLRERKRLATMVAIEDSATALVLEHGYDAVTVEQICAAADISKRTFFNYVPSKDAAVIGTTPENVSDEAREEFLSSDDPDVPLSVLRMFMGAFAATRVADDAQTVTLAQRRREIFRAEPDLGLLRMTASARFHLRLAALVTEFLESRPDLRRLPEVPVEAESRACVALVAASGQLGLSTWLTRESGTFADLDEDCIAALRMIARLVTPTGSTS